MSSENETCPLKMMTPSTLLTPIEKISRAVLESNDLEAFKAAVADLPKECLTETRVEDGHTPLMLAVLEDRLDFVQFLLDEGVSPFVLTQDTVFRIPPVSMALVGGRNLLHIAYKHGVSQELIRFLEQRHPEMSQQEDLNGNLPAALSKKTVDPVLPSKRRLLRMRLMFQEFLSIKPFEAFVTKPISEFFLSPPDSPLVMLAPGLSSFQMLSPEAADRLLQFINDDQKQGSPSEQPNTMNKYGRNLRDTKTWHVLSHLLLDYVGRLMKAHVDVAIRPFSDGQTALPAFAEGFRMESLNETFEFTEHYSFVIEYHAADDAEHEEGSGKDRLNFHYDASYFTINLCLELPDEEEASQAPLYFDYSGKHDAADFVNTTNLFPVYHKKGRAYLHDGKLRHGASSIQKGSRTNLIIWAK